MFDLNIITLVKPLLSVTLQVSIVVIFVIFAICNSSEHWDRFACIYGDTSNFMDLLLVYNTVKKRQICLIVNTDQQFHLFVFSSSSCNLWVCLKNKS